MKIVTNAFYVIGFPGETVAEMRRPPRWRSTFSGGARYSNLFIATHALRHGALRHLHRKRLYQGKSIAGDLAKSTQIFGEPLLSTDTFTRMTSGRSCGTIAPGSKRELAIFSLKHPLYAARRIRDKMSVVKKLLFGK